MYEGTQLNKGQSQSGHHCDKHLCFRLSTLQMVQAEKREQTRKYRLESI